MPHFTHAAAYHFATLSDLKPLRQDLITRCKSLGIKGTILISTEGVNLFISGQRGDVDALLDHLRTLPGLARLTPKYNPCDHQPYNRMLVRIKKEIIAFGVDGVDPAKRTSPKLSAKDLKQWLDEGRPVTLLDTRNDYEIKLGTFKNAIPIGVDTFRQFPDAVRRLPEELKKQPIVMFCTGGIRCEKAGPFMEMEGFENIHQLDGGILKYFEECGGDHYDGECFVFDQRVGVDPSLHETESTQCYSCQSPLTAEDQKDPRFVTGKTCPYCYLTTEEQRAQTLAQRNADFARVTTPLPGSQPYVNHRPLNVPAPCDGFTTLDFLSHILPHTDREKWISIIEANELIDDDGRPYRADEIVRAGQRCLHVLPATVEPEVARDIEVLHEDEAIVAILKPAPLPVHPGGRFHRNTLAWIMGQVYHPEKPRPIHRLDANTTGIVLYARTRHFAALLQRQFLEGGVEKIYLAHVQGHPETDLFECRAPISPEPGRAGTRSIDEDEGQDAHTLFRVLERRADGTSLLEAQPLTGRTNQIRIHLAQLNHPIIGDATYSAGGHAASVQTLPLGAAPLELHAWKLSIIHPVSREPMTLEAPKPAWA
ncbi:MAG: RluA family pseudouridine synthase [Verrucomicrobiaceae bacterium]|nr:RluA family pseudouridine synthase [Verrucomicrobiaceae bacterium]